MLSYKHLTNLDRKSLGPWKRYYYDYIDSFLSFIVPENSPDNAYKIISDELGHVKDIQVYLEKQREGLNIDGRIVITNHNSLWEPILRLASILGLRNKASEYNWLSMQDLKNFSHLAGFEVVKYGTKMLIPIYIPLMSWIFNVLLANIWPLNKLGLFNYLVIRKQEPRISTGASVSIIIPARNEAGTIEKIARNLPQIGTFTELIFVEGNSTDKTYEKIVMVAESLGESQKIKYCKQDGKGKGNAVRKGFDIASGDILIIYDADMTVPPTEIIKFYNAIISNKGDFINGSRLIYPLEKESMRLLNIFANKFFSLMFSWILNQTIKDTLCGTKVIWRSDYQKIKDNRTYFGDFDPFGDFDLLFGAAKLNLKIIDLPIRYERRTYGSTNISRWTHGWLLLKMTLFAMRKIKFV